MQGWRLEMEDSDIVADLGIDGHSLVAIFDGHGGAGSAQYAAIHLIEELESTTEWQSYRLAGDCNNGVLLGEAMTQAFLNIDVKLRAHQLLNKQDTSGCTAVCAIINPNVIVCINAGDSRCVLGTDRNTKPLSFDHKPTDGGERERIQNAGGTVQWKRVDGDLAVSRALGDFQFKTGKELHVKDQKVTCYPDVIVHQRTETDDVLILACDGVWDVFSNEDAVGSLRELFGRGERDMALAAEELVDMALVKGSMDNISAVIVGLPGAMYGEGAGVQGLRAERDAERLAKEAARAAKEDSLRGDAKGSN